MPGTRKLGKTSDQRIAMLRQQVTDFLDNGKMETTITRAKEIKPMAEKMYQADIWPQSSLPHRPSILLRYILFMISRCQYCVFQGCEVQAYRNGI